MTPTGRLLAVLAVGLVAVTFCSAATIPPLAKRKLCGSKLIELVGKLCNGCVKGPGNTVMTKLQKKQLSFEEQMLTSMRHLPWDELIEYDSAGERLQQPSRQSSEPLRVKRGIVEECCHKSCPMSTLKEYCADSC
uniref:Insulin-like domain-containing protein n=1 Tax=Plectus sambesii TaxID=2011161 RepID=A0A914WVN0_9BILA